MMQNSAKDKVVVITGGSAGIGRATARLFASTGAGVGIIARDEDRLKLTEKEIIKLGGEAVPVSADVAVAKDVEKAADKIETMLGPIDIWINNAMTSVFSPFKKMTPEEFKRVTEVTYLGQVYGTMAALRKMLPRDRGKIVQVGSVLAYRAIPLQSAYSGAKHAIQGFTESVRSELIHDENNIGITMVQLPAHNTPQFDWVRNKLPLKPQPIPPIYQPEVAAEAIYYAAFSDKREIYVGTTSLFSIILNKIFPGLTDKYLAKIGYSSQMTDDPIEADTPDNLWDPVQGDYAAHGRFDNRSKEKSWEFEIVKNKKWIAVGVLGILGIGMLLKTTD